MDVKVLSDFIPLTEPRSIASSSYKVQVGVIQNRWALKILKGIDCISVKIYNPIQFEPESQNVIVNDIIQSLSVPNINPRSVFDALQVVLKESYNKKEHLLNSEEYKKRIVTKNRQMEGLRIQLADLHKKLKFYNKIQDLIDNNASGNRILSEYNSFHGNEKSMFALYENMLDKLGEKEIKKKILEEKSSSSRFKQLNSANSFQQFVKVQREQIKRQINQLESILIN